MTSLDQTDTLLRALLQERPEYAGMEIPASLSGKRELLRSLMNLRPPAPLAPRLLEIQDEILAGLREEKGVVDPESAAPSPLFPRMRLWQGDITRLRTEAIVNAANSKLLGCFVPLHRCIDNAIHSAAGMQLREECHRLMRAQGHDEPTGQAKITRAYNLPARRVIHTVGPIVYGPAPTQEDRRLLASCYESCLSLAEANNLASIAFCCISTGEFHFPQEQAAEIAVATVRAYLDRHPRSCIGMVVFNVFKDEDLSIYKRLLGYE